MNNTALGRKTVSTVELDQQTCSRLTELGAPDHANGATESIRFTTTLIAPSNNSMTPARQARIRSCLISCKVPNDVSTFNPDYKSGQTGRLTERHLSESPEWTQ